VASAVLASYLCRDHVGLARFYADTFGWTTVPEVESPIFTALDSGRFVLGFHHDDAHDLLDIGGRRGQRGSALHLTIDVGTADDVDAMVGPLLAAGATIVKHPFTTYYGARQVVLDDPEGNLLRISSSQPGVSDR
jgi:predicted enzyme related to lactoylglutathione lyase